MILDEVDLLVRAGNGGKGAASFRREKYIARGGPDGGNGGRGGDVFFIGTDDLTALNAFRSEKKIIGIDGGNGKSKKMHGKNAPAIFIRIPIGTSITNIETGRIININDVGQKICIARGGNGGIGNWEQRSAGNQAPQHAIPEKPGEEVRLHLNLAFIADIGLVGLPNAGKSSLLNAITNAHAKIGDYPFTTLEPNLGSLDGIIIADIPGLIEGASSGKGLGIKFLKHIEKTRFIVHCIDITADNIVANYHTVREELKKYNPLLAGKREIIFLTKKDALSADETKAKIMKFATISDSVVAISIIDDKDIEIITSLLKKKIDRKP